MARPRGNPAPTPPIFNKAAATSPHDPGEFTDMLTGKPHTLQDLPVPAYGFYYLEQTL